MEQIKSIFFDLGNVVVKLRPEALEEGYKSCCKLEKGAFIDFITDMDSRDINQYMEGKITSSQFYNRTRRRFKMDISFPDFYRVWNSMFDHYPEVEEIIRTIKKKYPEVKLILVSNTNEAHYEYIKGQFKILELFDACVVSHEHGRQKPVPSIFNEAMRLSGSMPKTTFYTDDRLDLIEAARVMGFRAFQFVGHEELRAQLAKCGLPL